LGPIGAAVGKLAAERENLELVGGVDIAPNIIGKDVGEAIGLSRTLGFKVTKTLAETLERTQANVVLHTTNSYFDLFKPQIMEILGAGLDIVSTSEELSFPWRTNKEPADEIAAAAKKAGKTVLGTGVNPGFLMDTLPLNLSAICQRVDRVDIVRVINASERRGPFQAKIGSGLTVEAFKAKMAEGRMGHVGLPESMAMLFDTLGRELVRYEDKIEPVVADVTTKTDFFTVEPGMAKGLRQVGRGYTKDGEFATMTFHAALATEDDGDTIKITGHPNLEVKLKGTNGDYCTVAMAVNAVRRVHEAAPGLVTMRDLPIVTA
jgi:4-hydroxy-tetrahydrodipicolinate reductase